MEKNYKVKLYRADLGEYYVAGFETLQGAVRYVAAKNGCSDPAWIKYYGGDVIIYNEDDDPCMRGDILRPGMYVYEMEEVNEDLETTKYYGLYSSVERLFEDVAFYANQDIYTVTCSTSTQFPPLFSPEGILEVLAFSGENGNLADWLIDSEDTRKEMPGDFFSFLPVQPLHTQLRIIRRLVL